MKYHLKFGVILLLLLALISCTTSDKKEAKGSLKVIIEGLLKALDGSEATVNITGSANKTLSFNGSGEETITDLAVGNYSVTASSFAGHVAPSSQSIEVTRGATAEVKLVYKLEPGNTIEAKDSNSNGNPTIQPNDEPDKQHMEGADLLLAGEEGSVLIGVLGGDTLVGNKGNDILIGGPENFVGPNSDVIYGDEGDDINIWAPGDGSDAFLGGGGIDVMIFAPFKNQSAPGAVPTLTNVNGRDIPQVSVSDKPQFSCEIETVPSEQKLGYEQIVRFSVNGDLKVTVRLHKVEFVYCPSDQVDNVKVAELAKSVNFSDIALSSLANTLLGEIMQP